ncbi:peptidase family M49-domain-containing protein [Aspergillus similis]
MAAPEIFQLSVASGFSRLGPDQRLYAHHMSRAAWNGTRIILRQVSPEANSIFDFIIALYFSCNGDWDRLASRADLDFDDLQLQRHSSACASPHVVALWEQICEPMFQKPPLSLGPPGELMQSAYYLGYEDGASSFREDAALASRIMQELSILPENTRLRRARLRAGEVLSIMQASVAETRTPYNGDIGDAVQSDQVIEVITGDHKNELARINAHLGKALEYVSNQSYFTTGNLTAYQESQSIWVRDKAPMVEAVFGFVEPYRDPLGVRSEFEGIVGIPDSCETQKLRELSEGADKFVCKLPWVTGDIGNRGPFEKPLFEAPDFSSVQSTNGFLSLGYPYAQYNDIRQNVGYKNIIFSNRMLAESHRARGLYMVPESDQAIFKQHRPHAYYIWVVLHEIFGHGTGRFLTETTPGNFSFDPNDPPSNPITGDPVKTWYKPGQTWTGVFEDISTTVDECRAELVGAYLLDDPEILALFGYTQKGHIKPDDLVYNLYLQLATDGLRGLENYDPVTRAHYAIFRHLLRDSANLYTVVCDTGASKLTVKLDRSRIVHEGKPSLGRMLLRLHIYRCSADNASCRDFYESLSNVDSEALTWREIVIAKKDPPLVFSQANTFIHDDAVELREYEPTARGVIQSWAEREIQ